MLPGLKPSLLDKTVESINLRLAALGCPPVIERRCAHDEAALAAAIAEIRTARVALILISGASAITDRRDVVPAALTRVGGTVEHLGMPVDPGNLLMLGRLGDQPVLGLPGCARSPKLNGFDWVLQRLVADLPVGRRDIMLMGAGGLLKEIPSRPQPRAEPATAAVAPRAPRIAALVLAAGRSSRMGSNKLLAEVAGKPMLTHVVDAALASQARPVVVVTGNEADRVAAALGDRPAQLVHNADFAAGISGSLKAGLRALDDQVDGALVCLADMPLLGAATLDRLIAAFNPVEGRAICVPTWNGKRGNPVLWSRRFFAEMAELAGDVGARHLIGEHADQVCEVAMADDAVLLDIDTPEALASLRREPLRTA
jgi:molybdenum cofactor cytidylyltransferase